MDGSAWRSDWSWRPDAPTGLGEADRLILTATRHWVAALFAPAGSAEAQHHLQAWQAGFCGACCCAAGGAWDQVLGRIALGSRKMLDVRCVGAGELSADEHILLSCVASWQQGRPCEPARILGSWLTTEAVAPALHHGMICAQTLKRAGLTLYSQPLDRTAWMIPRSESGVTVH
ncbi:MAG: hypothetical protein ACFB22_00590 [Rhodothalassiaceae bacterium]